jgi:NADPH:quinone reductase-like Zn-dependent oxidoreductase
MEGLRRAGIPKSGETILVMGVNGKVGQAATQIASWHGARVIGVVRKREPYEGHANSSVEVIDASATDVAPRGRELTGGKGADIVFNTVGDPYFQAAHKSLALRGRQILIATIERVVPFNILEFYRGQHTYVGIDTLGLSSVATGAVLRFWLCQRPSQAIPDQRQRNLSAAGRQGCLRRGSRLVARSGDPAAGRRQIVCGG